MRCAVLCSGYTRTFMQTHNSLRKFIRSNPKWEVDLFFSVNQGDREIGKHQDAPNTANLENTTETLKSFNPRVMIFNQESANASKGDVFGYKQGQYQNLAKLFRVFEEFEKESGLDYDILIRTRFDNEITSEINLEYFGRTNDNQIFVPAGFFYGLTKDFKSWWNHKKLDWSKVDIQTVSDEISNNYILNDRFAIGNRKSMTKYFDFGEVEFEIHEIMKRKAGLSSTEAALAYHLKQEDIEIICKHDLWTRLVR